MAYRLKKDGQIVYLSRTSKLMLDGTYTHLTKAEVGSAGTVYEDLPNFIKEEIYDGKLDDIWETIPMEELQGTVETEPTTNLEEKQEKSTKQTIIERPSKIEAVNLDDPSLLEKSKEHGHRIDFSKVPSDDLAKLIKDHEIKVDGTGAGGNVLHRDLVKALEEAHPHDFHHS